MINAGTVGAYLELDISQFSDGLSAAGQMLEHFRQQYDDDFGGSRGLGQSLLEGLTAGILTAGNVLSEFVGQFGSAADSIRGDAESAGDAVGGLGQNMQTAAQAAAGLYSEEIASAAGAVAQAVQGVSAALSENGEAWAALSQQQGSCGEQISQNAIQSADTVCSAFGQVPGQTQGFMLNAWVGMKAELDSGKPQLFSAAKSDGDGILSGVDSALGSSSPSGGMRAVGSRAVGLLRGGMEEQRPSAQTTAIGIMQGMVTAAGSVSFTGIGGHVVSGILSGINEKAPSLLSRAASLAGNIAETIRRALNINSPSKIMIPMGQAVTEGMEVGLMQGAGSLYKTASAISLEAADALGDISTPGLNHSAVQSTDHGDKLEKLLDAVERLADSRTTMEIDGRSFGRLVRSAQRS